jgi:hypothetical protein
MRHWRTFLVGVFVLLAVHSVIVVNYFFRQFTKSDAEYGEHFGAFIGGYFGAMFALAGIFLLYRTLRSQQAASADQDLANARQNLANAQQNFETKYFQLIKMHRDNVEEISVRGSCGRRVFVLMLRELRCALEIIRRLAQTSGQTLTERQLQHIAYYCLFFGVGPNSSRMLRKSLKEFDSKFINSVESELNRQDTKERVRAERKFSYIPFEGHQSRLGHYYRHLYQTVRFVDGQPEELKIDKYEHVKTIRAQLSTHEQALLLINSLTPIGRNWWEKELIVEYKLVKNIPEDFFDNGVEFDGCSLFKRGYFEWEEASPNA